FSRDWSSDVCSSDLGRQQARAVVPVRVAQRGVVGGPRVELAEQPGPATLVGPFLGQRPPRLEVGGERAREALPRRRRERDVEVGEQLRPTGQRTRLVVAGADALASLLGLRRSRPTGGGAAGRRADEGAWSVKQHLR